jgi:hypothetical protein
MIPGRLAGGELLRAIEGLRVVERPLHQRSLLAREPVGDGDERRGAVERLRLYEAEIP